MAKFCTKCGRPLQEGEACSCQEDKKDDLPVFSNTKDSVDRANIASYVKSVWSEYKRIFKDPIGEIKKLADTDKLEESMPLVVAHIIIIFLASIVAMMALHIKLGEYAGWLDIPYAKIVFYVTLIYAATDFLFAGTFFFTSTKIYNEHMSFAQILSIIGPELLLNVTFTVAGIIFMFLNTYIGLIVMCAGLLLCSFVIPMGYYELSKLQPSKRLYSLFTTYVIYTVILAIIYYLFLKNSGILDTIEYFF